MHDDATMHEEDQRTLARRGAASDASGAITQSSSVNNDLCRLRGHACALRRQADAYGLGVKLRAAGVRGPDEIRAARQSR